MKKFWIYLIAPMILILPANAQQRNAPRHIEQNIGTTAQNRVAAVRNAAAQNRVDLQQKWDRIKQQAQAERQKFQKELETKRDEIKSRIEKQKENLKARLAKIKDENKKKIVERINDQINELNTKLTDHYSAVLDKLGDILNRISSRADKAAANNVDVSSVRTAITAAQSAIDGARTAVKAQAGKTYPITVNAESTLKTDVGKARQAFHSDITAVFNSVKTARQAVQNAATTLGKIRNVDELEATSTPENTK